MYWLGLLTHLQSSAVPGKVPECLRDLRLMYEAATIDDINDAYLHFNMDNDNVFTCVGTSGPNPPPQQRGLAQPQLELSHRSRNGQVAVGKPKGMDGKVLLSVAAALQGNGLAQAMQELTNRITKDDTQ